VTSFTIVSRAPTAAFAGDAPYVIALIDLDTLSRMPITVELGDALRSWCQPGGEESQTPLELEFFAASVQGWAQAVGAMPSGAERDGIGLVAKRLDHITNSDPPRVRIISDNPLYKPYEGGGDEVNIIGRIRWFARDM
jgi:hypothetical protein